MKNLKLYLSFLLITAFFSIVNLKCESVLGVIFDGVLEGTATSGSGNLALGDASVILTTGDGDNNSFIVLDSTTTDVNGHYQFVNVTTGLKKLKFRKGIFADSVLVDIQNNQLYKNENGNLGLNPEIKLAYLFGERDNIQQIVTQLGYPINQIQVSDFNSLNTLMEYRYIFINSGNDSRFNLNTPQISGNISAYLDSGGMIYASDWAIESLLPLFDLPGLYNGNSQTIPNANVVDAELMSFLNKNTAQLQYDLNEWYSLDSAIDCNIYVHYLRGNYIVNQNGVNVTVEDRPLAVYQNVGVNGGKFIYTTFRNESPTTADVIKILQFYAFQ